VSTSARLIAIYELLLDHFGPQHWWPAESAFEMLVGAVLTQNTSWQNVRKAINNLRDGGVLNFEGMFSLSAPELANLIRPSGYYNLKAGRLRNLLVFIDERYGGSLEGLLTQDTDVARQELLSVKGIGQETADSILLYGGNHPIFVVDAYTHRIFSRHRLVPDECDYSTLQELFMESLPPDAALFNEYHALIVKTAKTYCSKTNPRCESCPLREDERTV